MLRFVATCHDRKAMTTGALRRLSDATRSARAADEKILATVDTSERVPFQCECGRDYCRQYVWLSLAEFSDCIDRGRLVIALHQSHAAVA